MRELISAQTFFFVLFCLHFFGFTLMGGVLPSFFFLFFLLAWLLAFILSSSLACLLACMLALPSSSRSTQKRQMIFKSMETLPNSFMNEFVSCQPFCSFDLENSFCYLFVLVLLLFLRRSSCIARHYCLQLTNSLFNSSPISSFILAPFFFRHVVSW